jgi:glutaredoxin
MATKTKTKDKLSKALKNKLIGELKDKKETERLERVEANSKLNEVIIYTQSTCPYCTNMKKAMDDEGIKYVEKEFTKFNKEWNSVVETTQIPVFPTIKIGDEFLAARRDFQQVSQAIQRIIVMADPERSTLSREIRMIEGLKTLNYNMSMAFQQQSNQMKPLQEFITKIQKEIEEETKAEEAKGE